MRLFEINGQHTQFPVYVKLSGLFRKNELPTLCRQAIEASPDKKLDTRQLATAVMLAKGWDATDKALRVSVGVRITHSLTMLAKRGKFRREGHRAGVNVWA